jgi:3-phenylpropionate/cinnamic acid dioxygenase small subunit
MVHGMADAHEAIRNLLGSYCELMDAGDFDGLAALFADGWLSDENGTVFARGSDEIATMWHAQTILHDGSPRTRHLTANTIIELDEADGSATVRSTYVVLQATAEMSLQPIITGRYVDRFVRGEDGTWRWQERRYTVDHVGDLSHHLKRPAKTS